MTHQNVALAAVLALSLYGCDDPADEVAAATVLEETPAAETPAAEENAENTENAGERETLAISNEASTIGFTGSKVTGSHDGGFREFAGTIEFDANDPTQSTVSVTIQTASLFTDSERLTGHLKSDEFFDVENIPTATFRTTEIATGGDGDATHTLTGVLNLHGVEQTIRFPATVAVSDDEVSASAEFSINRQQFGITYPGRPDDLIRDAVVIRLELKAPRG
ncbi:MAG: YceI family protein [Myxococcota bacterium]